MVATGYVIDAGHVAVGAFIEVHPAIWHLELRVDVSACFDGHPLLLTHKSILTSVTIRDHQQSGIPR